MRTRQTTMIIFGLFMVGSSLLALSLARGIVDLLAVRLRIEDTQNKVMELAEKHSKLKNENEWRNSAAYKDVQIREYLQMAKPGDITVIMPENIDDFGFGGVEQDGDNNNEERVYVSIWSRWVGLLWQ